MGASRLCWAGAIAFFAVAAGCGPSQAQAGTDAAAPDAVAADTASATDVGSADAPVGGEVATADAAVADSGLDVAAGDTGDAVAPKDAAGSVDVLAPADVPVAADVAADVPVAVDVAAPVDIAASDAPTTPAVGNLVEAGWSFGECMGDCTGKLEFAGAGMSMTVHNVATKADTLYKGYLTTGAAAKLEGYENALAGKGLQAVYGCPDCADGGAAYVVFSDGKTTVKTTYEFAKPPALLADVDKLVTAAIAGLKACKDDETVVISKPCPQGSP